MHLEVFRFPQNQYFYFLSFQTFKGTPENAPNHIWSWSSARKILKMAIKSELLGLCCWKFWNFLFSMRLSNGEYFKDFKFYDFGWNDPIWFLISEAAIKSHFAQNYWKISIKELNFSVQLIPIFLSGILKFGVT